MAVLTRLVQSVRRWLGATDVSSAPDLVVLATSGSESLAELWHERLNAVGIPSIVSPPLSAYLEHAVYVAGGYALRVRRSDAHIAASILGLEAPQTD